MRSKIAIIALLLAMLLAAGCGNQKEIVETAETTSAMEPTTAATDAETVAVTTAAVEISGTESSITSTSVVTTAAENAPIGTAQTAPRPVDTRPQATRTQVTRPQATRPQVTKPAVTNPAVPAPVETVPVQTQNPSKTNTIVPVPGMPQTDTETRTEPVSGSVKITNGVMVVDSGTSQARALEIFSGSFKTGTRYAEALNRYKAALGENVNVYCMVVPTSAAFYMPDSHAAKYGSQLDNYNNIAASLNGVIGVPVYSAISAHTSEYLYSRTDYHWQPLAAYYAGEQFAMTAGVPYATLDTYTPVVREGYVGAFYAVNKVKELANAPDTFTYYKPANLDSITCTYYNTAFGNARNGKLFFENNSIGASYTVFVGTDNCILQVDTNVENDRVLVIFKDSYGNALVPFLTQSFSKIYLCDFRYFDRNAISFAQQVGATDMLFAMSTVACTTSSKVGLVEKNLTK